MALAENHMGLGQPPGLAALSSEGGTGPVTLTAGGTSQSTATAIKGGQFVVYVNALNASAQGAVRLPDFVHPADKYVVANGLGSSITVYAPTNATVNIGGAAYQTTAPFTLATLKSLIFFTVTATQGFGLSA